MCRRVDEFFTPLKKRCYGKAAITGWSPSPFVCDSTPPTKHACDDFDPPYDDDLPDYSNIKRALFLDDSASSGEEEEEEREEVQQVALCTKSTASRSAKRKIGSSKSSSGMTLDLLQQEWASRVKNTADLEKKLALAVEEIATLRVGTAMNDDKVNDDMEGPVAFEFDRDMSDGYDDKTNIVSCVSGKVLSDETKLTGVLIDSLGMATKFNFVKQPHLLTAAAAAKEIGEIYVKDRTQYKISSRFPMCCSPHPTCSEKRSEAAATITPCSTESPKLEVNIIAAGRGKIAPEDTQYGKLLAKAKDKQPKEFQQEKDGLKRGNAKQEIPVASAELKEAQTAERDATRKVLEQMGATHANAETGAEQSAKRYKHECDEKFPMTNNNEKAMAQQDLAICLEVHGCMTSKKLNRINFPFLEPVDHTMYSDYLVVVKRPMDLRTLKESLVSGFYSTEEEFYTDAKLIFDNAVVYNRDKMSAWVVDLANAMMKALERLWKKAQKNAAPGECNNAHHRKSQKGTPTQRINWRWMTTPPPKRRCCGKL